MRYVMPILLFAILSILVGVAIQPTDNIIYSNGSETVCHGKTCTHYLLTQMGNRTINIDSPVKPEICSQANWAYCNEYDIKIVN